MNFRCVLGIETSCDETGVAIYHAERGIIAHQVHSQIALHQPYGGVVPELASRDHVRKLLPLVESVLHEAGVSQSEIDGIAYTQGPGLIGALLIGASFARALAYAWQLPSVGVHHLEAHVFAALLDASRPEFPFLTLLVSGGHTQLLAVRGLGDYELLGDTLDDAVGEAFDKSAKLLGLPYPGGPQLAKLAELGNKKRFHFPRPMTKGRQDLTMSFSGLKTHVMQVVQREAHTDQDRADIACAFEEAVVDTLVTKCATGLQQTGFKRLVVAGGVAANRKLRERLKEDVDGEIYFPNLALCTDNGAMVAFTGFCRLNQIKIDEDSLEIKVKPRWPLNDVNVL